MIKKNVNLESIKRQITVELYWYNCMYPVSEEIEGFVARLRGPGL